MLDTEQQVWICKPQDETKTFAFRQERREEAFTGHDEGRWRVLGSPMVIEPGQKSIFCLLRHFRKGGSMNTDYCSTRAEAEKSVAFFDKYHTQWRHDIVELPLV